MESFKFGAVVGTVTGFSSSFAKARLNRQNPWNGSLDSKQLTKDYGLQKSIDRINNGEGFPHKNDGSIFQNREGLLPNQNRGYYNEFVHPTPGVNSAGLQRIILGNSGEIYFTQDHYKTFIRIK